MLKMRKLLALFCVLAMVAVMAACGGSTSSSTPPAGSGSTSASATGEPLKVALLLNGTLGDKSFFDSANNGMEMVKSQLSNVETKVVEMTYDDTKWEPALLDIIDEGHDIIITGTWQMQEIVSRIAPDYPDQKFIVYDTAMDYSGGEYENVYSIEYKQNDGSFLAGALAASMSKTGQIGFVGGMDNTVIYDFLVGYIQGAKAVNPDVRVASSFVGNFSDAARAKELATSQYNMGADIIFSCASTAGDGTMQAGKELGKYIIGVDSDQAMLYMETDPTLANLIPTSMLKRVDVSLFQAIEAAQKGELAWGTRVAVGIPEDCVGLADNEVYQTVVPQETRDLIDGYIEEIKNGSVTVDSAFDMENAALLAYVDGAK
ncbi:MAG: BMP family protein [Oscillospiraceae bacterium]